MTNDENDKINNSRNAFFLSFYFVSWFGIGQILRFVQMKIYSVNVLCNTRSLLNHSNGIKTVFFVFSKCNVKKMISERELRQTLKQHSAPCT